MDMWIYISTHSILPQGPCRIGPSSFAIRYFFFLSGEINLQLWYMKGKLIQKGTFILRNFPLPLLPNSVTSKFDHTLNYCVSLYINLLLP